MVKIVVDTDNNLCAENKEKNKITQKREGTLLKEARRVAEKFLIIKKAIP